MAPRRLSALSQFSRKSLWYENVLENQGVGPAPCRATFPSSSPLTPASQSGLHRPTCQGPSKPRATAAFSEIRLGLRVGNWATEAPFRPLVSEATFWCLVFAGINLRLLKPWLVGARAIGDNQGAVAPCKAHSQAAPRTARRR